MAVNLKIPTESIGRRETGDNILNILGRELWNRQMATDFFQINLVRRDLSYFLCVESSWGSFKTLFWIRRVIIARAHNYSWMQWMPALLLLGKSSVMNHKIMYRSHLQKTCNINANKADNVLIMIFSAYTFTSQVQVQIFFKQKITCWEVKIFLVDMNLRAVFKFMHLIV